MRSYVIFSVLDRLYGIDIECVKRILPSQFLTAMPDEEAHIEGMFQYEDEIIKVLSFRKVIGERSYEEELLELFPDLKSQHKQWLDALKNSVENGVDFLHTTDPHACQLGKWIDSFHPDDKHVVDRMKKLDFHHQRLHRSAIDVLEHCDTDPELAKNLLSENIKDIYNSTLEHLAKVSDMSDKISASMQRCLILVGKDDKSFGMNIDAVDDIVHVEEQELHLANEVQTMGEYMNVSAILEHKGKLITIVKDISINRRGE